MGDLHFQRLYPNIDLAAGGSVQDWPATIDEVLKLEFDGVIPGHGRYTDRAGLLQYQQFMAQLAGLATQAVADGVSRSDFVKSAALTEDAGYGEIRIVVPIGLTREFVLTRAWEEATGNFKRRD